MSVSQIEIIKIIDRAMVLLAEMYGSPGASVVWLTSPQVLLEDRVPLEMIRNEKGPEVMRCLEQISDCVYL